MDPASTANPAAAPIGFLAPMPSELRPLRRSLSLTAEGKGHAAVHRGIHVDRPVVALLTGIGMDHAEDRTRHLLATHEVAHVIVIGVAGGLGHHVAVGDVVVPEVVVDRRDGRELRPHPLGDVPLRGRLLSGDEFVTDPVELARLRDGGAVAIDMESAAIGRVCDEHGCPWSVFRGISDDAFDPAVDEAVLGLTRPDGSPDTTAVARYVVRDPRRVRLLARLARDLQTATGAAVEAALRALRTEAAAQGRPGRDR